MKENFDVQYNDFKTMGLKKYKNHQVQIDHYLQRYLKYLKEAARVDDSNKRYNQIIVNKDGTLQEIEEESDEEDNRLDTDMISNMNSDNED